MSNIKRRVLVIVGGLALALIMGAVSDTTEKGSTYADLHDSSVRIAGHTSSHGGG